MSKKSKAVEVQSNRVKINTPEGINSPVTIQFPVGESSIEITVTPSISVSDKTRFINEIVSGCFNGSEYMPHYKKELIDIVTLEYFTNVDVDMPTDDLFLLINQTDIIPLVLDQINKNQVFDIYQVIDELIEYRKQEILSTQKQELEKAFSALEQYVGAFSSVGKAFENVDTAEMMDMFKKISSKSEYELASAVLATRAESEANNAIQLTF